MPAKNGMIISDNKNMIPTNKRNTAPQKKVFRQPSFNTAAITSLSLWFSYKIGRYSQFFDI